MANANERAFAHPSEAGYFISEDARNNLFRASAALQLLIDAGDAGSVMDPDAVSAVSQYIQLDLREVSDDARFCPGSSDSDGRPR